MRQCSHIIFKTNTIFKYGDLAKTGVYRILLLSLLLCRSKDHGKPLIKYQLNALRCSTCLHVHGSAESLVELYIENGK